MRCLLNIRSLCRPTATRIGVGLNVAIPACSLCINRRLYKIATMNAVMFTSSDKRRAVIYDLFIGVGIPILQMASRKYAWTSTVDLFLTSMQSRLYYFCQSLRHI